MNSEISSLIWAQPSILRCIPSIASRFFGTAALRSMRPAQSRTYVDEAFEGAPLQPKDIQGRARMHQWISSVNSYYYPYMIYHVVHERLVFPQLGIATDEKVVAHAHAQGRARARGDGECPWSRRRLPPR